MTQSAAANNQRSKPRKRRATEVDLSVGARLRQARLLAGAGQGDVGAAIGVSFQAVQMYENGENRLSAGRLAAAARYLGVPLSFFFQDDAELEAAIETAGFSDKEVTLIRHYRAIRSDNLREHLLRLMKMVSEPIPSSRLDKRSAADGGPMAGLPGGTSRLG
jgi:transcriptional regulator with XRE-family HTH domain